MSKNTFVNIKPGVAVITPLALAKMSTELFEAGIGYSPEKKVSRAKYYLFCASIELALKSAILAMDCTEERKEFLKKISHNLDSALFECEKLYDLSFLTEDDREAIKKINPYFKGKGLEYFTVEMMEASLTGYKKLPRINSLEEAAVKLQTFLEGNKNFKYAKTSFQPTHGIINFI